MRQISLREFRNRGSKALGDVPVGETVLLASQEGPIYFLVPVVGDIVREEQELRRAMAKASLRENWSIAEKSGSEALQEDEIEREIDEVRTGHQDRKIR